MTGARREDVESIEAIVGAFYDTLSGPAGPRDWDRLRNLGAPTARMMPGRPQEDGSHSLQVFDMEGYIASRTPFFLENSFYEEEVACRVERFGNIAHAWSTYEARHTPDGEVFMRGINSIQLYFDGDRWWTMGVIWDIERPGTPIPPEYG
jgi:hypothetical protein